MVELKKGEFKNVLSLLNKEKVHCTFAYSVTEGRQPGRIYVDNIKQPKACLITCRSGKYLVAGETNSTTFNEFLSDYLYNRENHSNYFDLYSSSHEWIVKIDELLGDNAAKLSRAEIDIVTKDEFRRQGYALATCSEFIKYCVSNNIKPVWDCDNGNENSKKLADKLGFKSVETYEMHWWHENKNFVRMYLENFKYNND